MILAGCSGLGCNCVSRYAGRIRMLAELEQALQYLYGEIEYSGCDMIELMEKLAMRQGYFEALWRNMGNSLQGYDGQGFFVHWKRALEAVKETGFLKSEDMELLYSIGANLGNMDRQTQLHTLNIFQRRLSEILMQARREYREKAKVSSIAWITAGLLLSLVLI